ncbi:hypothetical protein RDI58_026959 [Solanum bulbocastanum]|uniref:Uncharacterized protein n=1 Tax=Solanum bulbocastanum TaxID=147425 RepID=A0AAN8T1C7_SOLBU
MKQPPNIPTRVLTNFLPVSSKVAIRSPSLLYCFKYIGQFFKGSELELAISVGSQGSTTLFQRLREDEYYDVKGKVDTSSQVHIFLSLKMKQPPNIPTRVLTIFLPVSSKAATRSPSLLYCSKYIDSSSRGVN